MSNNDVFFEPWVGSEYKYGIKFDEAEKWESFKPMEGEKEEKWEERRKNEGYYKVMALGLEHYCSEEDHHCDNKNSEQQFYVENLKIFRDKLKDDKEIERYVKKLIEVHHPKIKEKVNTKYHDSLYVLYKDKKWKLDKIRKELGLSTLEDLSLYMAIEKILTMHSCWNKELEEQVKKIKEVVGDFNKFEEEAKRCGPCKMHTSFKCPICKQEEMKCHYCSQIPICRKMTVREIAGYVEGLPEYDSHLDFHKAFSPRYLKLKKIEKELNDSEKNKIKKMGKSNTNKEDIQNAQNRLHQIKKWIGIINREILIEREKFWNHLLFLNFMQRGMPQKTNNKHYQTSTETKRGVYALIEVLTVQKPDIIFLWGSESTAIWQGIEKNRQELINAGISIRQMLQNKEKYTIPRMHINNCKEKIPFTVLDVNGKEGNKHPCLVVLIWHPQYWPRRGKDFLNRFVALYIKCALTHAGNLIKWDYTATNYNGKQIAVPPTCDFDANLKWLNQADFPI